MARPKNANGGDLREIVWDMDDAAAAPVRDLNDPMVFAPPLGGTPYLRILAGLHQLLRPPTYLEVGLLGGDAFRLGSDQCTGELTLRKHRVSGNQDQHLIQISSEGLGSNLVLTVKQVAPWFDLLNRAFIGRGLP